MRCIKRFVSQFSQCGQCRCCERTGDELRSFGRVSGVLGGRRAGHHHECQVDLMCIDLTSTTV